MSVKRSRKLPLEWKTDVISTSDATVTNGVIDLELTQDEIAEIYLIDNTHIMGNIPDAANDLVDSESLISMDPDVSDDPGTVTNLEDLEHLFYHYFSNQQEVGAAGTATLKLTDNKQLKLPETAPLLVGTNLGRSVKGDAAIAVDFITTVYFKRRRATASELNQILLKRR